MANQLKWFLANHVANKTGAIRIDEKEILSTSNPEVIRILNYQKENKSFDPMLWVKPIINRLEQTGLLISWNFRFSFYLMLRKYWFFGKSIIRKLKNILDCKRRGWILEGFPKTRLQAIELKRVGLSPDYLIVLDAPNSVLLGKLSIIRSHLRYPIISNKIWRTL